jgi:hypothetical protein
MSAGRDGPGFGADLSSAWNDSSEFVCANTLTFRVDVATGPCAGRFVKVAFDINGGGTSNVSHSFSYEINCDTSGWRPRLTHTLGFDGLTPQNIDNAKKVYNITGLQQGGGDVVTVTTTLGVPPLPGLHPGGVFALAVLIGLGLLLLIRRRRLHLDVA